MTRMLSTLAFVLLAAATSLAADSPQTPNIIFCIADDSSCHYGAYGCKWSKTPNVDRLAAGGLTFENFYTPTAKCAPSRASILTGRNPWQCEAAANHQTFFPPNYKAFTEVLGDAGYYVGSWGKFWGPGSASTADGKTRTWGVSVPHFGAKGTEDPTEGFRKFLASRPKGKPYFFWCGSTNPHRPYKLDSGLEAGKKPGDVDHVPAFWPDNDTVRRDMLDYAIEVEAFDTQVGQVLTVLNETGEADNTLVIVTSDHGMPFPRVKGHNYDLSNRIPFVACWPKGIQNPGRKVSEFCSLIDVAPTVLALMGQDAAKGGMQSITGSDLLDLFAGESTRDRSTVIIGRERNDVYARPGTEAGLGYPVRGIREGNLLYLRNFEPDRWPCGNVELGLLDTDDSPTKQLIEDLGEKDRFWQFCFGKRPGEELFDLAADPDCVKNLVDQPGYREKATAMREKLFAKLNDQQDPRMQGKGEIFDNYPTTKGAPGTKPAGKGKKANKK